MRVLVACEFSGIVRDAFARRGHDAWSCDVLPSESAGRHIQGDVLSYLEDALCNDGRGIDLMIAHPPCTFLANSGNKHLYLQPDRERNAQDAAAFFRALMDVPIPKICIENPIMRHAIQRVGRKQDQIIQPWQFGHGETKATCLWLKGLPKLIPTNIVEGREARIHLMAPGPNRSLERSRTYQGIADAMATQWA